MSNFVQLLIAAVLSQSAPAENKDSSSTVAETVIFCENASAITGDDYLLPFKNAETGKICDIFYWKSVPEA